MLREELWRDVGALGGFPIFFVLTLFALFFSRFLFGSLLIGFVLTLGLTTLIRAIYFHDRPIKETYNNFIRKIHASSFPSLHTMRASLVATVLGMSIQNYPLFALFLVTAAGVGYSRVRSKRHFIKDVVVGYILGVLIGLASYYVAWRVVF
ncbi:MAG TPA: phosphatase PAP2 family protein [Candidatus Nanoarchaeia archaeon]|nr:phosphatase PAP2 family protein [Candidatus Nanoarchaeia archaeon]